MPGARVVAALAAPDRSGGLATRTDAVAEVLAGAVAEWERLAGLERARGV